jgi:NTP pyrophosphohydrolases containing a Zn-finger, probably nucleic-acid-binding
MTDSGATALELTRGAVDRDAARRSDPGLFDALLADDATRIMPIWQGKTLADRQHTELALQRPADVSAALVRVYLGRALEASANEPAGTPVIASVLTDAAAAELEPDPQRWVGLRAAAAAMSGRDAGLFTQAIAITNWHASHGYCPRCGNPTVVEQGGWVRRCLVDDTEIFPRTDPAVIVRVLDADDRLLLGSNALWENNRWSLLAGFVEAGEAFEDAVEREVLEESGVRVTGARYLGSQPWPFPASIMIGMEARLAPGYDRDALVPDGQEILALRWFSRDDLWRERTHILLPGGSSIAHAIIRDWYGGPLDRPPSDRP